MVKKIKLRKEMQATKTLNSVSDVAGETINIKIGWKALGVAFGRNQEKFLDRNRGWAIRDPKLAEEFDYFTNSNNGGKLPRGWDSYMNLMTSAYRLFPRNGSQVGGLRAFKFLQQCVGDITFNIVYPSGTNALTSDFSDSIPANELGEEVPESDSKPVIVTPSNPPTNNPIATPGNPPTNNLIEIQLPLKDIPSKYWDRVEVGNDWDREYVEAENDKSLSWEGSRAVPMTFSHGIDGVKRPSMNPSEIAPWNRKFKSQKTLDNFKKYVDVNKEIKHYFDKPYNEGGKSASFAIRDLTIDTWFTTHLPSQLTKFLKDDNKLFIKDGYGKVTSQEAFEFLQSIIKSKEIKVAVKLTQNEIDLLNSPLNKGNRRNYVIRLKKGAKIIESLKKFAMDCEIGLAQFSMIGSVEDINVVFSLGRGKGTAGYHHVPMPISTEGDVLKEKVSAGQMELLTSWGNITWGYSEPFTPHVHCHASLADYEELKVFGGHLKEATVSITAEIIVEILSEKKVLKKLDEVDTEVNLWDFDKDAISFLSDQTGIKRLMKDEDLRKKVLLTTSEQKVIDKWKNYDFTIFPYKLKDDRWITLLFNGKKPNWVFIYAPFSNDGTDNIKAGIIIAEAIEFTKKIGLDTNDNYCFRHAFTNLGDDKTTSEVYVSAVVERLLPLLKNSPELFNDTKLMEINWDIWQGHRVKVESTRLDELKKEYENINEQKIIDNDEMSVALIQLPPKGSN